LFEITDDKTLPAMNAMQKGKFSLWSLSLPNRMTDRFGTVESETSIDATFSPDGRWVAYDIDDGSGPHVYVEPFPRTGERYLVTSERGWNPFWSPSGDQLYYSAGPDGFRLVAFTQRPTVAFKSLALVPRGRIWEPGLNSVDRRDYDLSPDGKRILGMLVAPTRQQALAPTIEVVLNWFEELKAKVP
jgi:Tol biopolymer transport system component